MDNKASGRDLWIAALRQSGYGVAKIATGSMSPLLETGDIVYIRFDEQSKYRTGDIVVFPVFNSLMVHRIAGRLWTPRGVFIIHRGDRAGLMNFGLVREDQILGKPVIVQKEGQSMKISSLSESGSYSILSLFYSFQGLIHLVRRTGANALQRSGFFS